jgi:acetyl-CoA carboxylase biotin carboxylase subunit
MFHKILIANRGEIALRIIRTCKEMGIRTVAVYSEADADSLHVRFADEDICIGPANNKESYLNIPSIISAAEITDAEAIHPGYGFLSENPHFVEVCQSCKIAFIGPGPDIMRTMADKVEARALLGKEGIPILRGSDKLESSEEGLKLADEIGYPIILKAAGGGGGKGMRVVHTTASFNNAFMTAQSEAAGAFEKPEIYLEKFLENPKHIEFQIIGDSHGNIIHLGERECSIQRRYQKLIEESPSPAVTPDLRKEMGKVALEVAKNVGYVGVGTIEFLLDQNGKFYFIEMNTRIQVEHPVTEAVTGIDLIKEQIRIAAGEKLRFKQKDINFKGHSIECRINAEDPETFVPSPGAITAYHIPGGPGVRVDTAAYTNYVVLPYYDSLVAKLIVWGQNRKEAIAKMRRSLKEFTIHGVKNTIPLHRKIFRNADFLKGDFSTKFLDNFLLTGG